jgi:CBS domain-containing protein
MTALLGDIMTRDVVCARPELDIDAVIGLMVDEHFGCVPVIDDRQRPIGMITKFDIVEHLHTRGADLLAVTTAGEIMMPLALTLQESATITDAALMMTCEDLHHVLVVDERGALAGVVSSKDIVTWLARGSRQERRPASHEDDCQADEHEREQGVQAP